MVGKDLLYQEAVLDFLEENNDIDFILLNDELPGEEIIEFMKKIKNTKIIIFTEKSRNIDKINLEKYAYKVFSNGEISIEEIKKIIKEQNYTEELEKEIEKLKNIIYEKENNKYAITKFIKSKTENKKSKIISIAGFESTAKTIFIIDLINTIKTKEKNVLLEVNNSSLNSDGYRAGALDNYKIMLNLCKKYKVKVILGSDAHISYAVGKFPNCEKLLKEINFPDELVINYNEAHIIEFFNI